MQESESVKVSGVFQFQCYGADGQLKWEERLPNQVMTSGVNYLLETGFRGGTPSPTWYMGLITGPGSGNTYSAADTAATHAGWTEDTTYSNATRPTMTFLAAAGGVLATSAGAQFDINGSTTLAGAFVINESTKCGTTGVLYSAKNFTAGDRTVVSGDIVVVSYSTTMTV